MMMDGNIVASPGESSFIFLPLIAVGCDLSGSMELKLMATAG